MLGTLNSRLAVVFSMEEDSHIDVIVTGLSIIIVTGLKSTVNSVGIQLLEGFVFLNSILSFCHIIIYKSMIQTLNYYVYK